MDSKVWNERRGEWVEPDYETTRRAEPDAVPVSADARYIVKHLGLAVFIAPLSIGLLAVVLSALMR